MSAQTGSSGHVSRYMGEAMGGHPQEAVQKNDAGSDQAARSVRMDIAKGISSIIQY